MIHVLLTHNVPTYKILHFRLIDLNDLVFFLLVNKHHTPRYFLRVYIRRIIISSHVASFEN